MESNGCAGASGAVYWRLPARQVPEVTTLLSQAQGLQWPSPLWDYVPLVPGGWICDADAGVWCGCDSALLHCASIGDVFPVGPSLGGVADRITVRDSAFIAEPSSRMR